MKALKKIEIITRPENLDKIKKILAKNEYSGMTVMAVMGAGHQDSGADAEEFQEMNMDVNLLPKVMVMTVVWEEDLEEILYELQTNLTTGSVGDGKIFISSVEDVMRIRNGERGADIL
jgi:nitrogen regulatory protein P-II 1